MRTCSVYLIFLSISYIVYGPLLYGCTTILFEGKPIHPDAGVLWRVIEEHGVNTLFAAPTGFRAIRQLDPEGDMTKKYDLSSLRSVFVAGERSDPSTLHWIENILSKNNVPAIDHWWQTELSFPGAGNAKGLGLIKPKHGACAAAVPGYDIRALGDDGEELPPNTLGNLAIKLPLPPGTLPTLYNNDERYIKDYLSKFPGYYDTMDAGMVDDEGYIHILSRTDDIINVSGMRLSTGAMEEILFEHPDVTDCAVIGVKDDLKGEIPIAFVVVSKRDSSKDSELFDELVSLVRKKLGPVSNFKNVAVVRALPKTRSGKILRQTMRKIANGEDYVITPTIEDPNIFDELQPIILDVVNKRK
jgi:propionyl-CoA synthetase